MRKKSNVFKTKKFNEYNKFIAELCKIATITNIYLRIKIFSNTYCYILAFIHMKNLRKKKKIFFFLDIEIQKTEHVHNIRTCL